jgi:hypothetical protein
VAVAVGSKVRLVTLCGVRDYSGVEAYEFSFPVPVVEITFSDEGCNYSDLYVNAGGKLYALSSLNNLTVRQSEARSTDKDEGWQEWLDEDYPIPVPELLVKSQAVFALSSDPGGTFAMGFPAPREAGREADRTNYSVSSRSTS